MSHGKAPLKSNGKRKGKEEEKPPWKKDMSTELTSDPRTGLDIVEVALEYMKHFSDLKGAVLHYFGPVEKYSRNWRPETRLCLISDQCIYITRPDGDIVRCLNIRFVQELLISEQKAVGFKVGAPERDLLITLPDETARDLVATIVGKVYYNLVGHKIKTRQLSGETADDSLLNCIKLDKPPGWQLKIEPIRSIKSLTKMMVERQRKEDEERRVVELQFHKIEEGLRVELQQYRAEEYSRLVQQLSDYAKQLEKKDDEIQRIKVTSISREDKEMWRHCPNCQELRRLLDNSTNDEKQKILRLEKQIQSQNHIVDHLQVAIQYRTAAAKEAAELGGNEESRKAHTALRTEIAGAQKKNRELQQLILESPYLTPDIKSRAVRLGGIEGPSGGGSEQTSAIAGGGGANSIMANADLAEMIQEKEREMRYLKQVLTDATQKQVQEMSTVQKLLLKYDAQVVLYLERVFREQAQMSGVDARKLAESAAVTAMRKAIDATRPRGEAQTVAQQNMAALLPRGFKPANPLGEGDLGRSGGLNHSGGGGGGGNNLTPSRMTPQSVALGLGTPNNGSIGTPRSGGLRPAAVAKSPLQLHLGGR